jgi:hypothetical protein
VGIERATDRAQYRPVTQPSPESVAGGDWRPDGKPNRPLTMFTVAFW